MERVELVESESDLQATLAVRRLVFVEGQGVPEHRELDGRDEVATHFLARDGDDVVGTARVREYDEETVKVERVAVLAGRRGEGWGRRLMDAVEAYAREAGRERVLLHAQVPVVGFYEELGYEPQGEAFEDAGIPHREMTKPV